MRRNSTPETKSALVNIAANVMSMAAFPLYLYYLSAENYGLWVTVSTLAGLCAFFELGASMPLQRFFLNGETHRFFRLLSVVSGIVILAGVLTFWLTNQYLANSFSNVLSDESLSSILLFLAIAELLTVFAGIAQCLLNISRKALICGQVRLVSQTIKLGLMILLLSTGYGLWGIAIAHLISALLSFFGSFIYSYKYIVLFREKSLDSTGEDTSISSDLAIGLDQWFLNIYNNFSARLIVLLLERMVFQSALLSGFDSGQAKTESLRQTGQAFILYRVIHIVFLTVKQGMPSYYHNVLSSKRADELIEATRVLLQMLMTAYITGVTFLVCVPSSAIPQSLVFLQGNTAPILATSFGFTLLCSVELANYILMVRGHLRDLKLLLSSNVAISLIVAAFWLKLGGSASVALSLAVCTGAMLYSIYVLYWLNRVYGSNGRIVYRLLNTAVLSVLGCAIPLGVLLIAAPKLQTVSLAVVSGLIFFAAAMFLSTGIRKLMPEYFGN